MKKFEFNPQIATSREQSKRLLELGLKKETSDMVWEKEIALDKIAHCPYYTGYYVLKPIGYLEDNWNKEDIPAWSLHRLMEIAYKGDILGCVALNFYERNIDVDYEQVIEVIERLIRTKGFNIDYLEGD